MDNQLSLEQSELEKISQPDLVNIVQVLIQKYGNDATMLVSEMMKKTAGKDVLDNHKTETALSILDSEKNLKQTKAQKQKNSKKEFDMSRYIYIYICMHIYVCIHI
jgi:antitoxin component HigA of HigAB toxin-antitoxin module